MEKRMGEGEGAGVRDGEVASEGEEEREKIRRVLGRRWQRECEYDYEKGTYVCAQYQNT